MIITRRILKTLLLVIVAAGITNQLFAQDARTITIDDAIELALEHNMQIRNAGYELRISESSIRETRSGFLPRVSVDAQYANNLKLPVIFLPPGSPFGDVLEVGTTHNMSMNAQVTMPLYNQSLITGLSLARANEELSQRIKQATRQEIVTEVQRAYLNVLLTGESLRTLQFSFDRREANLELVRSMHEEGMVPEFDLIRTSVQVENLKPQLRMAENAHTGSRNYLKLLTGVSIDEEIRLLETLEELYSSRWDEVPPQLLERNLVRNPDLLRQEAQLQLARQQLRMSRASYFPSLSLFGVNTYQAQGDQFRPFDYDWINTANIGVSLSVPIFSGFERRYQTQQARIRIEQQESQRAFLKESVAAEYENTLDQMFQARESIQAQKRNLSQAERGYNIARVGYENGTQNLMEVNDAELATTDARLNYLQSVSDYIRSRLDLELTLGLP